MVHQVLVKACLQQVLSEATHSTAVPSWRYRSSMWVLRTKLVSGGGTGRSDPWVVFMCVFTCSSEVFLCFVDEKLGRLVVPGPYRSRSFFFENFQAFGKRLVGSVSQVNADNSNNRQYNTSVI